jgi:hypothetical protein
LTVRSAGRKDDRTARTLWLSKDALLDTGSEGTVEQRVEHGVGGDLVVGADILLQGGTAGEVSAGSGKHTTRRNLGLGSRGGDKEESYLEPLRCKVALVNRVSG